MDYDALSRDELIRELKKHECKSNSLLALLSTLENGLITIDDKGAISYMNRAAEDLTGWKQEEACGRHHRDVLILEERFSSRPFTSDLRGLRDKNSLEGFFGSLNILNKNGTATQINIRLLPLDEACAQADMIITLQDITEIHHMGEEISRIQKLDALAKLAGGIAHSFNNMLTGIMGFSELLQGELEEESAKPELLTYSQEIIDTCEKASDVTVELLNFSRKRNLGCVWIDLNKQIGKAMEQLESMLGPEIKLETRIDAKKSFIQADPFQMNEIILNLGMNSRDVLKEGGSIRIISENRYFSDRECRKKSRLMKEGEYYVLTLKDTGPGIPSDVLPHIFDPFYTTKKTGEGRGLGLSSVYGSVISHGGIISVRTKEGEGATFEIALPLNATNCGSNSLENSQSC